MSVVSPMSLMSGSVVVFGSLVSLSSETWVSLWLGMELNLYGFLVMMNSSGRYVPEPSVKYFVIQSLGSIGMLSGIILSVEFFSGLGWPLMVSSVVMKTGIFPTHSWVPSVMKNSSWLCGALLLSWQKVAPLVFLSVILSDSVIWLAVVFMSLIGGVGGLNQYSVRLMSAYSSFVHTSWMFASLMFSMEMFILYFLLYSASVGALFHGCSLVEKSKASSKVSSGSIGLSLGMLSGVPPFVGFLSKLVVFAVTESLMILFCVAGSVISLKFYIDFFYSMILSSYKEKMYAGMAMSVVLVLAVNFSVFLGVVLLLM
uniref:NADH-ubiquinone oxidoreductase chain 2 n=2 Tax=Mytilus californianus TaxID=6549 RepID=J9RSD6_MYTCA|nr:NADH dehydrogenase subunit 2 [Mytilus californianus]